MKTGIRSRSSCATVSWRLPESVAMTRSGRSVTIVSRLGEIIPPTLGVLVAAAAAHAIGALHLRRDLAERRAVELVAARRGAGRAEWRVGHEAHLAVTERQPRRTHADGCREHTDH